MTTEQALAFAILGATLVLFAWGRWRYDIVAMAALMVSVALGLVAPDASFAGFGHPAVITVAAVLIISRGLQSAGIVDVVVKLIAPVRGFRTLQIATQCLVIAVLSGFMNNVGALALMLPVALRNAYRDGYPPSKSLMPLAFASLLGGLTTLIGTPPNIIIASFRAEAVGEPFAMFDFSAVGLPVAIGGLAFLVFVGIRLLPEGSVRGSGGDVFSISDYVAEARVVEGSKAVGMTVQEIEAAADGDVTVVGIGREKSARLLPAGFQRLQKGDVLMLRGDTDSLKTAIDATGLVMAETRKIKREDLRSKETVVMEVAVSAASRLVGENAVSARLRTVWRINLLALGRQGMAVNQRLGHVTFRPGDVLLLQGAAATINEALGELQLLPLADRTLDIGRRQMLATAAGLFVAAVATVLAGLVPVHIAFMSVACAFVLLDIVPAKEVYKAIEWPVIVLLAALLPVGGALESTGGAALIADAVLLVTEGLGTAWVIAILFIATMFVSDVINNNATAVLMAPIAMTLADRLEASPDPFLMAVAIGASCAFLTPVGHQSNTLVMEPGGYRFGDYWKVGLPLEAVIFVIALPIILILWPP